MEKNIEVSIIIVSYNTKELTLECVSSIVKHTKISYEIIIIDNNSSDGTVSTLKRKSLSKHLKIIENKENKGFAAANNQGIRIAKGRYILLLNSDTLLSSDCVSEATEFLNSNPDVAITSCRLKYKDGSLQPTGGYFPTIFSVFCWMFGFDDLPFLHQFIRSIHPKASFYKSDMYLDWVTGAFFLFRSEVTTSVGLLDEDYFMYVEELDFCYRVKSYGYKIYYLHEPSITHYGGASSTNSFALENELKNQLLFFKKHKSYIERVIVRFLFKLGTLLRGVAYAILGKSNERNIYFKLFENI